jgi:hypothetical protein
MRVVNYRPYCRRYALGSIDPISTPKDMLHAQCLHMGRTRTKVANDKMSRDEIQRISDWVESEMKKLMDSFLLFTNSVPLSTSRDRRAKGKPSRIRSSVDNQPSRTTIGAASVHPLAIPVSTRLFT